jgi:hypothetical protein
MKSDNKLLLLKFQEQFIFGLLFSVYSLFAFVSITIGDFKDISEIPLIITMPLLSFFLLMLAVIRTLAYLTESKPDLIAKLDIILKNKWMKNGCYVIIFINLFLFLFYRISYPKSIIQWQFLFLSLFFVGLQLIIENNWDLKESNK